MANLVGTMVYPDGTAFTGTLTLRLNGPAKDGSNNLVMPAYQNFAIGTTGVVDITIGDTESLTSIDSTQVFYEMILDDDDNPVKIGHLKVGTGTTFLADAWANTFSEPHASLLCYLPLNNMVNKYPQRAGNDIGTFSSAMRYNPGGKLGQCIYINGHSQGSAGDLLIYPPGSAFNGNRYAHMNGNQGAISFWWSQNWQGDDNAERTLLDMVSPSFARIYKSGSLNSSVGNNQIIAKVGGQNIGGTAVSNWSPGTFHHILVQWDVNNVITGSNKFEVYLDNVISADSASASTGTIPSNIYLGCRINNATQGNGAMDDLAIFDRPLTAAEISSIYNSYTGAEAGLLAGVSLLSYIKFDGSGNLTSGSNAAMGCSWPWQANLISDGDMETAGTASWTPFNATLAKINSGTNLKFDTQSLRVVASGTAVSGNAEQTLSVGSAVEYFISAWGKNAHSGPYAFLDGVTPNGAGESTWTLYEMALQATAAITGTLTLQGEIGGTGYFDNVWLGTSLLKNGGFEGAWAGGTIPGGWTVAPSGAAVGTARTSAKHGGGTCLTVWSGNNTGTYYQNAVTVTNAKWHAFVGYILASDGTCNIDLSGAATTTLTGTQSSWTRKAHVFKATGATLNVRCYANSTGTANFDDLAVIQLNDIDVTATPSSLADSYDNGKWGTAKGALRIDGGDTFTLPGTTTIGSNISYGTGGVAFWCKPEGWHGADSIGKTLFDAPDSSGNLTLNRIYIHKTGTNQLELVCYGSTAGGYKSIDVTVGTANMGSNAWHHIQAYWTAAGPDSLWLNGTSVGIASSGGTWSNMSATFGNIRFGCDIASASQFRGLIDEVRIYDKIPSTANKTAIYDDEEYLGQS